MNIKEKSFIFSARSRMIDVKCNFKSGLSDLKCRRCFKEDEDQKHLLSCSALSDNSIIDAGYLPQYEDLFSDSDKKIEKIGKILMTKFIQFNLPMCTDKSQVLLQPMQKWN